MLYYFVLLLLAFSLQGMEKQEPENEMPVNSIDAQRERAVTVEQTLSLIEDSHRFMDYLSQHKLTEMEKWLDEHQSYVKKGVFLREFLRDRKEPWVLDDAPGKSGILQYFKSMQLMKEKGVDFVNTEIQMIASPHTMTPLARAVYECNRYAVLVSLWLGAAAYEKTSQDQLPLEVALEGAWNEVGISIHKDVITCLLASMATKPEFKKITMHLLEKEKDTLCNPSLYSHARQFFAQFTRENALRDQYLQLLKYDPERKNTHFYLPAELAQGVMNYLPVQTKELKGIIQKEHVQLLVDHIGPIPQWAIPYIDHDAKKLTDLHTIHEIPEEPRQERGGCLIQ